MATTITLEHEGIEYTAEYTRKSIRAMETQLGFNVKDMGKIVTTQDNLVIGAFFANHKGMKKERALAIVDNLEEKQDFIEALTEMLTDTYTSLTEGNGKGKFTINK